MRKFEINNKLFGGFQYYLFYLHLDVKDSDTNDVLPILLFNFIASYTISKV